MRLARDRSYRQEIDAVIASFEMLGKSLNVDVAVLADVKPQEASEVLDDLVSFTEGQCQIVKATCNTCYDAKELITTTVATAKVNRALADMAAALDPRCWSACSDFFLDTYTVDKNAAAGYPKKNIAAALGQSWNDLLYERVQGAAVTYENLLNINFNVTSSQIRMDYSLNEALMPANGSLEIDEGYLLAESLPAQPGWTQLTMTKSVRFDDMSSAGGPWDFGELSNWLAPAALGLWLQDATQYGPCCSPE